MEFFLIQFIGAIAYGLLSLSYFKKEKKQILFIQIFAYIMFSIHYFLLNGLAGAICNVIGLIALVAIYLFDKYNLKNKKLMAMFFILVLMVINISTYQNIYSIFPMIASVIVIISFITDNEETIREIGALSAICWLIYAIVYKSYISIFFEVVTLLGVLIALVKTKREQKNNI